MHGGGTFLAFLVWYFILPLLFGYGRTLGKKIFGLAVIRTNLVKVSNPVLFVRTIVGMFAIGIIGSVFSAIVGKLENKLVPWRKK